eukprot:m.189168 g.189168  ORF g.189168 m.189168 type:complete len:160 (+) comp18528_c0_seq73:1186-1665(+)
MIPKTRFEIRCVHSDNPAMINHRFSARDTICTSDLVRSLPACKYFQTSMTFLPVSTGNLPYNIDEGALDEVFGRYGRIKNVTLGRNRETGQCRGFGFVTYEDARDAEDAFEKLQGYDLDGRVLRLDFDAGKDKKEEAGYLKPNGGGDRRDDDRHDDRRR